MKRLVCMMLMFCLVIGLSACDEKTTKKGYDNEGPHVMTVVDCTLGYAIYRHDETGVCYICREGGYGKSICLMVNADGTPYVWPVDE